MGRFFCSLLITAAVMLIAVTIRPSNSKAAGAAVPSLEPFALYGREALFDVERDGDIVGFHRTRFKVVDDTIFVNNRFEISIKILFINAFRFVYDSESAWTDGRLQELKVNVNDDGTVFALQAKGDGDGLRVDSDAGGYRVEGTVYPTNHWNARVLHQSQVLNTLTGSLNQVQIAPAGREPVITEVGEVMATRYIYSGDLETEAWYDDAGRWVKLRFKASDGTMIVYKCRRCQGGAIAAKGTRK